MKLRVRVMKIVTGGPFVIIINSKDAQVLDLEVLGRVRIRGKKRDVVAVADLAADELFVKQGEIVLLWDLAQELGVKEGEELEIHTEINPRSLMFIKKKLDGKGLNESEVSEIIKDLVENALTEVETTFFVAGCYRNGLSLDESAFLTKAIVRNGGRLNFEKKPVLDKHSIGGISGNRTTMIVVPIIAAAGFFIPKTSTRSISSPSGTSDTMEVLAPVAHSKEKIMSIVKKTKGCMVLGGTLDLASADDLLIKVERPLSLDPEGILLASIMAKKVAANVSHVVIDIPVGGEAKITSRKGARNLSGKFVALGRRVGIRVKAVITDGSEPIGWGVGPALEARDVLEVLHGRGPGDLRKKSLFLAASLLRMVGVKNAEKKVKDLLDSGAALKKMREIVGEQGGNAEITAEEIKVGKFVYEIRARMSGKISKVSNSLVCRIAKAAGAPANKGAGVLLNKKVKDSVKKGELVFKIYAESEEKLEYAKSLLKEEVFVIR